MPDLHCSFAGFFPRHCVVYFRLSIIFKVCVLRWHQIMDMAEKDESEGQCPACQSAYEKDKIVAMQTNCERIPAVGFPALVPGHQGPVHANPATAVAASNPKRSSATTGRSGGRRKSGKSSSKKDSK